MFPRFLLFTAAISAAFLTGCAKDAPTKPGGPPPPTPVSVGTATREQVPVVVTAIGTVEASSVIQVKSQIAGELLKVNFTEGQTVHKDDLLFEIDARPIREAIRQAEAALARDAALLTQSEANVARETAQSKSLEADAQRYEELFRQGVGARQQRDQAQEAAEAIRASIRADQAAVDSARAALESDRATIARNQLDLQYTQIHSPITGTAGTLLLHPGNLVAANSSTLVVINQVEPIWITFNVPEENLAAIRKNHAEHPLTIEASPQDQPTQVVTGALTFIDNAVDSTTGTIRLKATFSNESHSLWPGLYTTVKLKLDTIRDAVLVPSEAVQAGQSGQMVFVVKQDNTVEPRNVKAGMIVGNKTVVEEGVAPGDTVVTDGQMRLVPGARVQAVPAVGTTAPPAEPAANPAPAPAPSNAKGK